MVVFSQQFLSPYFFSLFKFFMAEIRIERRPKRKLWPLLIGTLLLLGLVWLVSKAFEDDRHKSIRKSSTTEVYRLKITEAHHPLVAQINF